MKKFLIMALVATVAAVSCGNSGKENTKEETKTADNTKHINSSASANGLAIAVVNTDSVLALYQFAIDANENMMKKAEDARLSLNTKGQQLGKEMAEFQNKIDNNAFLSRERAEQEAARLQKKQAELEQHGAKLENDFLIEQQKLSKQLKDSITMAISEVNRDGRFAMVLTNSSLTDNVIYVDKSLDITKDVIDFLNQRIQKK